MTARVGCARCRGPLLEPDALGLRIRHDADCELGAAEDSTLAHDRWLSGQHSTFTPFIYGDSPQLGATFRRVATEAERTILLGCGASSGSVLRTSVVVTFLTPSVRRREFDGIVVADLPGVQP